MLLRMIYDDKLAQAAYLIGCQRTGEAVVIDPERDVDRYITMAAKEGLRITAVAETHIHADFVSGTREMAERVGAKVYVSGEGGPDWNSRWLDKRSEAAGGGWYSHQVLRDGDTFRVGNIEFKALHTPGHTPEHMSYLITDRGGGASEPMGIATGDFVFVGDLGRPDLLETAAGETGAAKPAAQRLHGSLKRFLDLPDFLQVWPGHGAGSACGKALGAVPQTTVGYERRFNPAIRAAASAEEFTGFILEGQPEPPLYFARMKRLNREGPPVLGGLPRPRKLSAAEIRKVDVSRTALIDTRPWNQYRSGHLPGSLLMPLDGMLPAIAGSYIGEGQEIVLVAGEAAVEQLVRELVRVGQDHVTGYISPEVLEEYADAGGSLETTEEISVEEARERLSAGAFMLDVRRSAEFAEGHIPTAYNATHTRLPEHLRRIPKDRPVVVNCRSGARSARAAALLQREGFEVANLAGGYLAWEHEQAPVERSGSDAVPQR
jgi:hydroxyacylglutathione hydrolase